MFLRNFDTQIRGYVDADWAGCSNSRRLINGFISFLGNLLVSWRAKK